MIVLAKVGLQGIVSVTTDCLGGGAVTIHRASRGGECSPCPQIASNVEGARASKHELFAGKSYWFTPEGALFEPSATIGVEYDPARSSAGVSEKSVVAAFWNNTASKWDVLPSEVDAARSLVRTRVTNFGIFTALASTRPAAITADNISITPSSVEIGKEITVNAVVTNTGDVAGVYPVVFKVDDDNVASRDVTVAGKTSREVSFTASSNATGLHKVVVNGLTGTFTVNLPPPPKPTNSASAPKFTLPPMPTPTPFIMPTVPPTVPTVPLPTVTSPSGHSCFRLSNV